MRVPGHSRVRNRCAKRCTIWLESDPCSLDIEEHPDRQFRTLVRPPRQSFEDLFPLIDGVADDGDRSLRDREHLANHDARVTIRRADGFGTGRAEIDALFGARARLAVVDDPFEERDDHAAR